MYPPATRALCGLDMESVAAIRQQISAILKNAPKFTQSNFAFLESHLDELLATTSAQEFEQGLENISTKFSRVTVALDTVDSEAAQLVISLLNCLYRIVHLDENPASKHQTQVVTPRCRRLTQNHIVKYTIELLEESARPLTHTLTDLIDSIRRSMDLTAALRNLLMATRLNLTEVVYSALNADSERPLIVPDFIKQVLRKIESLFATHIEAAKANLLVEEQSYMTDLLRSLQSPYHLRSRASSSYHLDSSPDSHRTRSRQALRSSPYSQSVRSASQSSPSQSTARSVAAQQGNTSLAKRLSFWRKKD